MFYFLVTVGVALLIYGFKLRVSENQVYNQEKEQHYGSLVVSSDLEEEIKDVVGDLKERMDTLEKTLFEELLKWQLERESLKSDFLLESSSELPSRSTEVSEEEEEVSEKKPMPDHVKKVWDLLKEGRSTAEAAKELGISKGEVLLLKNLSKHYKE